MADAREYKNVSMSSMAYKTGRLRDERRVEVTPPVVRQLIKGVNTTAIVGGERRTMGV